jgi:hypothetical protein
MMVEEQILSEEDRVVFRDSMRTIEVSNVWEIFDFW